MCWQDPDSVNDEWEDKYYEWLEENCKCENTEECTCLSLEEWFDNLPEPDLDDLEENLQEEII